MYNNIPIVFCFDKRIVLGASVAIKSLIDCAKDTTTYDIRIFHSDLDIKNQKNITSLTKNTKHNISFHYIDPEIFKGAPHNNHSWTELVYYRLLIPEIIKEYDKVIYADVDVLFKGDLSEVYNQNLDDYELSAVPMEFNKEKELICHKYFPENKNEKIYISSFFVMNTKKMREEKTVEKFFKTIKQINTRLKMFDLDTLNITCDKFLDLPFSYGVLQSIMYNNDFNKASEYKFLQKMYSDEDLNNAKQNPIIIHYAGGMGKPWRMKKPYKEYQQYIDKLPKELKKLTFRDLRKRLFN